MCLAGSAEHLDEAARRGVQLARLPASENFMVKKEEIIGKHIDQFTVESFIAEGAMGMVFKAYDPTLARVVALKLISKNFKNATDLEALNRQEAQKRLIHEARTTGNLVHPNIVTVHSYGDTDEFQYICMEFIQGKTLSQILGERGTIPVEEAVPILEQILMAVETADKAGIVHRDIKPSNIMITEDKRVKVMDFGIAKLPSLSLTVTGMVLGTPYYMSPEQISGRKVDIRSDIFSLGAVFYELVTGEKPFEAENTSTLVYKIVQTDPIPPNIVNVNVPKAVARVISRAMAKDPSQRYKKPAEMLRDLKALASAAPMEPETVITSDAFLDRTVAAGQPGTGATEIGQQKTREGQKTRPNIPALVILLLLVVSAGGASLWYFHRIRGQDSTPAVTQQAIVSRDQPPAAKPAPPQPVAVQPQVPQPGPVTSPRQQPSADALLLEAGKQLISNPNGARDLMEKALTLDPNNYDCALSLARFLVSRKDYPAAIERYRQALSLKNSVADVHFELGNSYMAQIEWDKAIQSFEACLRLMPRNRDEVLATLGTCYAKKGDSDEAKHFFKQALDANPDNARAKSYMSSLMPTASATPSISPGAGATTSGPVQSGPQTSLQVPATLKTPRKSPGVSPEGDYILEGTSPDGTKYNGTAGVTQGGGRFLVTWMIAGQTLTGTGTLSGKILTVNRKDSGAKHGVVVYALGPDGMLKGTWGSGKGKEILKPVN